MRNQTVLPYSLDRAVELISERVRDRVRQDPAAPVFVGISGIDCSGKTTLAKALLPTLGDDGFATEIVSADDYIIPRADRRRDPVPHIDYFENTFDHTALAAHVAELRKGGADVVVAEGVFLFRRELVDLWELRVWLEMGAEQSVRRGAKRDAEYFGSEDKARAEYERRFVPAYNYHLERDRPAEQADLVFNVE